MLGEETNHSGGSAAPIEIELVEEIRLREADLFLLFFNRLGRRCSRGKQREARLGCCLSRCSFLFVLFLLNFCRSVLPYNDPRQNLQSQPIACQATQRD
jgi:hypothetical protein